MGFVLPRLYVILDAGLLRGQAEEIAAQMTEAGVRLLQYRAKNDPARKLLETSIRLAEVARREGATLFVNDRPDLAYLAGAHGVHVGQDDLDVEHARAIMGEGRWVGVSTHNLEQFQKAAGSSADYIAIGPIFATTTKAHPDPVVGTTLIRRIRPLTRKPVVAIGGIRLENAAEVIEAGADSVAVIGDILGAADPVARVREFLQRLKAAKPAAGY